MAIYSVDKLISEARKLAADYYRATGKPLAGVSGEVCLHDAINLLGLEASPGPGYDAVGRGVRAGKKVLVKGRTIFDEAKSGYRIGQLKLDQEWDLVMLVLMDADLEPFEIHEADREAIRDALATASSNRRGAMTVARFRRCGHLIWTREEGLLEDEVWDNQKSSA